MGSRLMLRRRTWSRWERSGLLEHWLVVLATTRSKVLNGGARSKRLQLLGMEGWHRLVRRDLHLWDAEESQLLLSWEPSRSDLAAWRYPPPWRAALLETEALPSLGIRAQFLCTNSSSTFRPRRLLR